MKAATHRVPACTKCNLVVDATVSCALGALFVAIRSYVSIVCTKTFRFQIMKVIVVGGGIAGLSATKVLLDKGHDVLLLEAQDSLGGRVKTVSSNLGKRRYDLGASWLHDAEHNVLYDVALSQNWPLLLENGPVKMFASIENNELNYEMLTDSEQTLLCCNTIPEDLGCDDASLSDMSLHDYALRKYDPRRALPIKAYEHYVGLDWDSISAIETPPHLHDHGTDAFQLAGNQKIIDWLLEECLKISTGSLEIIVGSPVVSIERNDSEITVFANNSKVFRCAKLIMTASLGHLQKRYKSLFKGQLPSSLESAMKNGTMASLAKVIIEFPYRFWRNDWKRAHIFHKERSCFVNDIYEQVEDGDLPALVFLLGPPLSTMLERDNGIAWKMIKPMLYAVIQHKYSEVPDPAHIWISDWSLNPWFEGSYSSLRVGQNMRDLILPMMQGAWDEKLLFAGEHTTIHGVGCMDGAYMSGIRAANQI